MVNSELINEIVDTLKLDTRVDTIPNAIPVIDVNPKSVRNGRVLHGTLHNASSVTLMVTSATGKTYINGVQLAYTKDATATTTAFYIQVVIDSTGKYIVYIPLTTLTAGYDSISYQFKQPILLDKGASVTLVSLTDVANFTVNVVVDYMVDDIT